MAKNMEDNMGTGDTYGSNMMVLEFLVAMAQGMIDLNVIMVIS